MGHAFFDHPILNSPYACPARHWELDADGQPTQKIIEQRRRAEFITPIPKPKKRRKAADNWVVLDSDWEAEFCRVAEAHPRVRAYVKNHNLGLEVPYRYGSETRRYRPDFVVRVDDRPSPGGSGPASGRADDDLLNLVVEIKGYRGEDAKVKKTTMDTYWIPGVNNHGSHGRWAFAEFCDVYEIQADFAAKVAQQFDAMVAKAAAQAGGGR